MQVNKNIHLCQVKAPIYKLSRSNAPKTQCRYRHTTKNQWTFLLYTTGVNFSSRNIFSNLSSFAKVLVPVGSMIPRVNQIIYKGCFPYKDR